MIYIEARDNQNEYSVLNRHAYTITLQYQVEKFQVMNASDERTCLRRLYISYNNSFFLIYIFYIFLIVYTKLFTLWGFLTYGTVAAIAPDAASIIPDTMNGHWYDPVRSYRIP